MTGAIGITAAAGAMKAVSVEIWLGEEGAASQISGSITWQRWTAALAVRPPIIFHTVGGHGFGPFDV
jgi:hypothetical protein